jgi:hypothetical protein
MAEEASYPTPPGEKVVHTGNGAAGVDSDPRVQLHLELPLERAGLW